ncbi:MAG: hypothetical protein KDD02_04790 [Phaeodactylibacter sp.]|nr:hypothetical protein [Phaeodactylibacter sp.]MCB9304154.1 hypothetical protein [Lewinellaceae bacterium]
MMMFEKDNSLYEKALEWVRRKGYSTVKVNIDTEDFEKPTSFSQPGEEDMVVTPDLTALMRGNKCYFEIALKSDDKQSLITRWKLLDRLASMKEGKFYLFTPHGHRAFTSRLINQYDINAIVVNL